MKRVGYSRCRGCGELAITIGGGMDGSTKAIPQWWYTAALPGAKVAAMVFAHMRGVFMEHRKALKNTVEYCRRTRDPVAMP